VGALAGQVQGSETVLSVRTVQVQALHRNERLIQGTFGLVQGTFDLIQGTFSLIREHPVAFRKHLSASAQ
jgi:hypothetical protein